jgi:hypothetical protein
MASDALALRFEACWLPRRGHAPEEYEDAFAADAVRGRFAVADGASESSFAGPWAQLLVEAFVHTSAAPLGPWDAWLPAAQERWAREEHGSDLSWYAEAKFQEGAFAAFLGLVVDPPRWQAVAVGDSCLFQIRQDGLLRAFPLAGAGAFHNGPWLVGSRDSPGVVAKKEVCTNGDCCAGDRFWLMTDALAQWFLRETEAGARPWRELEGLVARPAPAAALADWAAQRWAAAQLRNDDLTVVDVQM